MEKKDNVLVTLRKREGFETAKAFAEALDVPYSTYRRYEAEPDKMPASAVRDIAEFCGVSADVVIGCVPIDRYDAPVQDFYDKLTAEGRELFGQLMEVVAQRDANLKKQAAQDEVQRYMAIARYYRRELLSVADVDPHFRDRVLFGTAADRRAAFEEFAKEKVDKRVRGQAAQAAEMRIAETCNADSFSFHQADGSVIREGDPGFAAKMEHYRSELVSEEIEKRRLKAEGELRRIVYGYDQANTSDHGPVEAALIEFI